MTRDQFTSQINRLKNTFGDKAYPEERVKLFYREFSSFDAGWFERTVDDFIGSEKYAPMLDQFRIKAAVQRERQREKDRLREEKEIHGFMTGAIFNDEKRDYIKVITARMQNKINDTDWAYFLSIMEEGEKLHPQQLGCKKCQGSGLDVYERDHRTYVRACYCRHGDQFARVYGRAS